MIENMIEMLAWNEPAAQFGATGARAAIGHMEGKRRRDREIQFQPGPAQDEHDAVYPDRKAASGAGGAQHSEGGRASLWRDRITGHGGKDRGRSGIVSKHGHWFAPLARSFPRVI